MQPSPRETRVALTELHMGQYISTYNWGDEENSSYSPWLPCHCSVTVVKEKKDQITPMCVANGNVEGSSWPLSLEMDTFIVKLMYLAYWWQTRAKTDLFHLIQSYVVYHLDVEICDQDYQFEVSILWTFNWKYSFTYKNVHITPQL